MPPEQESKPAEVTPASDIYSFGLTLWQCLTGKLPDKKTNWPTPTASVNGVSSELGDVCVRCVADSPSHRYATAEELAQDLARVRTGKPTTDPWAAPSRLRLGFLSMLAGLSATAGAAVALSPMAQRAPTDVLVVCVAALLGGALAVLWPIPEPARLIQLGDAYDLLGAFLGALVGVRLGATAGGDPLGTATGALMGACIGGSVRPVAPLLYAVALTPAAMVLMVLLAGRLLGKPLPPSISVGMVVVGYSVAAVVSRSPAEQSVLPRWRVLWVLLRLVFVLAGFLVLLSKG